MATRMTSKRIVQKIVSALKESSKTRDLERGEKLHLEAATAGCHTDKYVATALINMYGKCGKMSKARHIFNRMNNRDVITWNSLITGYVQNGESSTVIELFFAMDCEPDLVTFVAAMKSCASLAVTSREAEKLLFLEKGITIHIRLKGSSCESDMIVRSTLVDMYSKCGSMLHARTVFDNMYKKDVVAWNCLILGYVENGNYNAAMELYLNMDCEPDVVSCIASLKAVAGLATQSSDIAEKNLLVDKGKMIHRQVKQHVYELNVAVTSSLIDMYSKCGDMPNAREAFNQLENRNVVTWNCLLLGYVENGHSLIALELLHSMDCEPSHVTYIAALKAWTSLAAENLLEMDFCEAKGMEVHAELRNRGCDRNLMVANCLLEMYSKCRRVGIARLLFNKMAVKDVVSWNSLILGYVENRKCSVAIDLFSCMDCQPDCVTFIAVIKACSGLLGEDFVKEFCLYKGMTFHQRVRELGYESNLLIASSLVDMYSKCAFMPGARDVFDKMARRDVVVWNSLILGYVENGESSKAMELFKNMDCDPDFVTFLAALRSCTGLASKDDGLRKGKAIHKQLRDRELDSDVVAASILIDMYSKLGDMLSARELFETMPLKNVVSWTSLILGYIESGESFLALELFSRMDCQPDCVTLVAALKACGNLGALEVGRTVHASICKLGLEQDEMVSTSLVDFYGKSCSMNAAGSVFDGLISRDVVSWSALIAGYSSEGDTSLVLSLVRELQEAGLCMSGEILLCVLSACSHAGMVEEGLRHFNSICWRDGTTLTVEHYNCMVDLLGRANRLQEALSLVHAMPFEPNEVTWKTLLGAARKWNNLEIGKLAFDAIVVANTADSTPYVLMGDILKQQHMFRPLL